MDIKKLERLAKTLAKKSNHRKYRYGCILYHRKRIISVGINLMKTHPKSPHPWKHMHSEFHCILGVPLNELEGASMFIYMERKKNGNIGVAKPCPTCYKMLENCGIKTVTYSTNSGYESYSYY